MSGRGETAGGRGEVSSGRGWGGGGDRTQGERIWSSFERQKVKRGLLLIIHILWVGIKEKEFPSDVPPLRNNNERICF
jgi:hypothetical protein